MYTIDWKAVRRNAEIARQSKPKKTRPRVMRTYVPDSSSFNESFETIKNNLDKVWGIRR